MTTPTKILNKIGDNIRSVRKTQKCSIEVLALLSGIHRNTLWKIEKGKTRCDLVTLYRIADSLKVDIKTLL